jgi:hypothetical protein
MKKHMWCNWFYRLNLKFCPFTLLK